MTVFQKVLIFITILLGLLVRTYKINGPVADWHSHRQADTASVSNIFLRDGIDILHPKYHDLSNVQSGLENPQGYRMVELPIYNSICVIFSKTFNTNIDLSSRLVSIIFSLFSALLIFLICLRITKLFLPSLLSMAVFLFLPLSIYYSRTILPEPAAVFFMLLSLYTFPLNLFVSGISLSLSMLIKPYTALIIFPYLLTHLILHKKTYLNLKSFVKLILFSVIALVPFFMWRQWIGQFPEGIPKSDWLLNNGITTTFPVWFHGYNLSFLNKLVAFRPHWWQWLFLERISILILGGFGIIPLFLGTVFKKNYTQQYSFSLIIGIFLYFVIIAQGNIQHDYYQVLILPFIAILCGFGYYYISKFTYSSTFLSISVALLIFVFASYFSWTKVSSNYNVGNNSIIEAGQMAQKLLPKNSLIIAPYNGDTALLYQTGFSGWPTEVYDIPEQINKYPQKELFLVSVNFDTYTSSQTSKYKTIFKNNDFIILKLSP